MNTNQDHPCNHVLNESGVQCHPYLRTSFRTYTPVDKTLDDNCVQKSLPCGSCCVPETYQKCTGANLHYGNTSNGITEKHPKVKQKTSENYGKTSEASNGKHLRCVGHSCPLGTIVCCSPLNDKDCKFDKNIIKASDVRPGQDNDRREQEDSREEMPRNVERPCCAKNTSWTEPRMCRCDLSNPTARRCECECGATIENEPKDKSKKKVRFDDQVTTYVECDKAFRNLKEEDIKELCSCCKDCAVKGQEQCVGRPVLVYELPEPKFEGSSVTHNDFCWQKTPQVEVPPWHPNVKDRWHHMEVPSLAETTYQSDFKPPAVSHAEREPVYLAPQREKKSDPCQKLAEEYSTWKKTSTGPEHVYHSSCETCDRDLHRVHLHECNVASLPPQYQCHGDGHICEPPYHTVGKFTLCETGDAGESRYWWQRSCCGPDRDDKAKICDVPPDLLKPASPGYTTCYKYDYRDPKKVQNEGSYLGKCSACEYCAGERKYDAPKLLCTEDSNQPLITQRAGII